MRTAAAATAINDRQITGLSGPADFELDIAVVLVAPVASRSTFVTVMTAMASHPE
jgi:hypothetical protein